MKDKGFTLIELLAVIVILGIIMVIAITSVSNVISSSKQNSYDIQNKLIVDAARKYVTSMTGGVSTNSEKIITLKDLQDNSYVEQNIKDPRTGSLLSNKTWIIAKNNNGKMEYIYGYETDGLVFHYDAKNNGGLGIYNDNSSANKGTWYDLSGNNYNAVLHNFSYDTTSGWQSDSLKLDSTNDNVTMDVPGGQEITLNDGAAFSITFKCNQLAAEYTYFPYGEGSGGSMNFGWGSHNNVFIFYGGGKNSVMGQSNFTMTAGTSYNVVFVQEKDFTKKIYINGILVSTETVSNYTPSRFKISWLTYNTQSLLNSNYYSIKVYNRGLTSTEVSHNYDVDKMIYGL